MNPTSRPLRGALVGCGNVARHHLAAWSRVVGAELVALCDVLPDRLDRARSLVPSARTYNVLDTLLDEESLDFLEICTGPEAHLPIIARAARRGVHCLCQKPVTTTRDALIEILLLCDESHVALMVHENWRFRPWNRALRACLETGVVGRPIRLRLSHHDTRALTPDGFREQPFLGSMPQLILMEMGCHLVDTARFLMGEVESVHATTSRFGVGHPGEDVATLSLEFVGGALGLLDMSWCAVSDPRFSRAEWALNATVIEGTEGSLAVTSDGQLVRTGLDGDVRVIPVGLPPVDQVYVDAFRATQQHFIDRLRSGGMHETSGHDTLKTMEVVWAAYRSAGDGTTVAL
ncbi:MAG: Gfo/Idh/MocA family oxidoreductase [Isosphaeraceae bacterium]